MAETRIKQDQAGVPPAGTTGQGLIKNSNADFDYSWADIPLPPIVSGSVVDGSLTFNFTHTGKLYFVLNASDTSPSCFFNDAPTANRLAFLLGGTLASSFPNNTLSGAGLIFYQWNGAAWVGTNVPGPNPTFLSAILLS